MSKKIDPGQLTILVTGATSGFGLAICRRFAQEGSNVIATGRRKDRLNNLKMELGQNVLTLCYDVSDINQTQKALARLPKDFSNINIVVANAGLALGLELAQKASLSDWDQMVKTNINGLLYTIRSVLPAMVKRNAGHIVLIGSVAGDFPYPGGNVYGATKAFVKQLALNLRADLFGTLVRVTCLEPGLAETEFSLVRFKGNKRKAKLPYQGVTALSAEDIAEAVYWTCTLPAHVNVNSLQLMPIMQSFGPLVVKRK